MISPCTGALHVKDLYIVSPCTKTIHFKDLHIYPFWLYWNTTRQGPSHLLYWVCCPYLLQKHYFRLSNGSINPGSLYHDILWTSKRSLKVGKCVHLLDLLGKLYKMSTSAFILQTYSSKVIKEFLLINCSDSDSDSELSRTYIFCLLGITAQ